LRQGIYGTYTGTNENVRKVKNYLRAGKSAKEIAVLLLPRVTDKAVYKMIERHEDLKDTFKETVTTRWVYPRCMRQVA
jgi:hypothetical protein